MPSDAPKARGGSAQSKQTASQGKRKSSASKSRSNTQKASAKGNTSKKPGRKGKGLEAVQEEDEEGENFANNDEYMNAAGTDSDVDWDLLNKD